MSDCAHSAAKPVISLFMIVKNEAANLPRCLSSARPYVDEIIVVDTGSQDETVAIAQAYGAKVDHFKWCDDFAAARNYALMKVTGDWVLMLDADEELVVEDPDLWQVLPDRPEVLAYAITRVDLTELEADLVGGFHVRLFRNLPGFRYVNRFHEQLKYDGDRDRCSDQLAGMQILHHGNETEAMVRQKALNRDIPILESIRQQEGLSFWLLDCLAKKYLRTEQFDQAQACYEEALDRLLPHLLSGNPPEDIYWVPTLMHFLATQSLNAEDLETARMLCQRGLEWFPQFLPILYLTGEILLKLGFPLGAIAYFERCLHLAQTDNFYSSEPIERSLLGVAPACAIGAAAMELKDWQAAISAYNLALSFDPNCPIAQTQLNKLQTLANPAS